MKAVIITGISSGLGRSLFRILSDSGLKVVGISRRFLPEQTEKAQRSGGRIVLLEADLAATWQIPGIPRLRLTLDQLGCADLVFISNAGTIQPISATGHADPVAIRDAMAVNMLAPMLLVRELCEHVHRIQGRLTILNISSGAASRAIAGWGSYCSAKAGIRMFLDVVAEENANSPAVRVVHIDPGVLDTEMQTTIRNSDKSDMPSRDVFVRLDIEGKHRNPDDVACELVSRYLEQ